MMMPRFQGDLPTHLELAAIWAQRLSDLSDKLSEADLYPLMVVGSLVYQKACLELEAEEQAGLVIHMARRQ
ncbi:hypothetical protein [Undibacterium sp.]|uniref:hypothetical protein n=1 Tax=unclassified Undibacterium TaxID=2630295 RepID=UPI00374D000F